MAGNGVPVVKMAMLFGIEFDLLAVVEAGRDASIRRHGFDGGKVAVGDAKRLVWSGELNTIADRKLARSFPIDADARESAWIVVSVTLDDVIGHIDAEIERLQEARVLLRAMDGSGPRRGRPRRQTGEPVPAKRRRKRQLSPEGRARIVEAVKRRWAKQAARKK